MRCPAWLFALLNLAAVIVVWPAAAAEPPVLAVLEYRSGLLAPNAKIRLVTGTVTSPLANQTHSVWTLREGDTIRQPNPPPERLIQLYQIRAREIQVVASVFVRYIAGSGGWRPAYALHVSPPAYWDGKRLVPLEGVVNAPLPIVVVATKGDAGDGFTHRLSIGSPAGAVSVDAWEVQ